MTQFQSKEEHVLIALFNLVMILRNSHPGSSRFIGQGSRAQVKCPVAQWAGWLGPRWSLRNSWFYWWDWFTIQSSEVIPRGEWGLITEAACVAHRRKPVTKMAPALSWDCPAVPSSCLWAHVTPRLRDMMSGSHQISSTPRHWVLGLYTPNEVWRFPKAHFICYYNQYLSYEKWKVRNI